MGVQCLASGASALVAGPEPGTQAPVGLVPMGLDGVCRLLADGYHYLQDNWGQAQAATRFGVTGGRYPPPGGCMLYPVVLPMAFPWPYSGPLPGEL